MKEKMIRIVLNIPDDMLKELDEIAKEESRSRSEIIREAVRFGIEQRKQERELIARRKRAGKMMDEIRAMTIGGNFDSTAFIRERRGPIGK